MLQLGDPIKEVPTEACNLKVGDRITLSTPHNALIMIIEEKWESGGTDYVKVREFSHPFAIETNEIIMVIVDV